jgi:hypothetical protein
MREGKLLQQNEMNKMARTVEVRGQDRSVW